MAQYWISADAIACTAATAETLIELGTGAAQRAKIKEVWVEFDGVNSANVPVKVEVGRFSAAATTGTTLAGNKVDPADGAAVTVAKHTITTEGAGTPTEVMNWRVSPTSGKHVFWPLGDEVVLAVSTFWRIRVTAAAAVNATAGVRWEE